MIRQLLRRAAWCSLISAGIVFDSIPGYKPDVWLVVGGFIALAGLLGMVSQ